MIHLWRKPPLRPGIIEQVVIEPRQAQPSQIDVVVDQIAILVILGNHLIAGIGVIGNECIITLPETAGGRPALNLIAEENRVILSE